MATLFQTDCTMTALSGSVARGGVLMVVQILRRSNTTRRSTGLGRIGKARPAEGRAPPKISLRWSPKGETGKTVEESETVRLDKVRQDGRPFGYAGRPEVRRPHLRGIPSRQ